MEDSDPPGAEWVGVTPFGSAFEEELDVTSDPPKFRHREQFGQGPWKEGPAPREMK